MDLLHAGSGEAIFVVFLRANTGRRGGGEEAVAARVVAEPSHLRLDLGAAGAADASDLGAQDHGVQRGEYGHEAEVRQRSLDGKGARAGVTDGELERGGEEHDRERRGR